MYIKRISFPLWTSIAVITLFICILIVFVISNAYHRYGSPLALGMTIDMVIILPLLPLLLSGRSGAAKYVSSVLFTIGILCAGRVIPTSEQFLLRYIKYWIVPIVELLSVSYLVIRVRKALKHLDSKADSSGDFYNELKKVTFSIIPNKIAYVVTSEIAVIYYLFFNHKKMLYNDKKFSYHKDTGAIALFGVLIFMVIVETMAFHLLLVRWSPKVAWILTVITAYAGVQLWGMTRAFLKRPIEITSNSLLLRYGLLAETEVPLINIQSVELLTKLDDSEPYVQQLSPLKLLNDFNVVVRLHQPAELCFIYGKVKTYQTIAFHVDKKQLFIECLNSKLAV
ncbi:hypothetical protein BDD43_0349 [Mucilaginibacter gracilis]|uniref:Beta-carotene 15,15'-monooxygenase n=1 Tax=Mucilaginibacter gracilis TaxID=423350 RepID=A0A495IUV4_9SPHI|nr:hypothetical protein [Mucilaginibacter gracilis]RKR80253.1 hypothetical protein BDD43_0349 [Mucilaginibacter gracilis]